MDKEIPDEIPLNEFYTPDELIDLEFTNRMVLGFETRIQKLYDDLTSMLLHKDNEKRWIDTEGLYDLGKLRFDIGDYLIDIEANPPKEDFS